MSGKAVPVVRYAYIEISQVGTSPSGKTARHVVRNRHGGEVLGTISWYPWWRQYTFNPAPETVYSSGCLSDIYQFVDACNVCHKHHTSPFPPGQRSPDMCESTATLVPRGRAR